MLELQMLPACEGDALWLRWGGSKKRQLLVDLGREQTGEEMRDRLEALPKSKRDFELLVITHVDRDHIGGVLTCLAEAEAIDGVKFGDIWFNGWAHLDGGTIAPDDEPSTLESMGPAQGERLTTWLDSQRWNGAFGGAPVQWVPGTAPKRIELPGKLFLTVLGPTPSLLKKFKPTWKTEVQEALRKGKLEEVSPGLEIMGSSEPPILDSVDDLNAHAVSENKKDGSKANGSSIVLLVEYKDWRILLTGDAHAGDLVKAISAAHPGGRMPVDAVKLPHHGSSKNVTDALVQSVDTPLWMISTSGANFKHPDSIAIARILRSSTEPRTLVFNVPSTYNGWWDNEDWKPRFEYDTWYGSADDGMIVEFE